MSIENINLNGIQTPINVTSQIKYHTFDYTGVDQTVVANGSKVITAANPLSSDKKILGIINFNTGNASGELVTLHANNGYFYIHNLTANAIQCSCEMIVAYID